MTTPSGISEEEFHDFVDGRLGAVDCARLTAHLERHAGDRARVEAYRAQIAGLHALYDGALGEPVPAALRATLAASARRQLLVRAALALLVAALGALGAWRLAG